MALFTEVQRLCVLLIPFGRRRRPLVRPSLLILRIDRPITQVHFLCCIGSLVVVLSLWRGDRNRMGSGENDDTWWYRTPSFLMTMQGVTPLLSRTSCAAGNGRFWNIHRTHPIWVHGIKISSGSEVRGFKPGRGRWIFSERKNPEYDFVRKGSKAVGPAA